jgi:tRNA G18 (ribose-2'-O)-methylase SpoU
MENVGSIFRTCDAVGVKKLFLCGITPKPPRKEIDKTALGAVDTVQWEYHENISDLIRELKQKNLQIIALEQDTRSISLDKINQYFEKNSKIAVIVGNEIEGVSKSALDLADIIVEIPMLGQKQSLNVSVATGIILYQILLCK